MTAQVYQIQEEIPEYRHPYRLFTRVLLFSIAFHLVIAGLYLWRHHFVSPSEKRTVRFTLVKDEHLPMLNAAKTALPNAEKSKQNKLAARRNQVSSAPKKSSVASKTSPQTNPQNSKLEKSEKHQETQQLPKTNPEGTHTKASTKRLVSTLKKSESHSLTKKVDTKQRVEKKTQKQKQEKKQQKKPDQEKTVQKTNKVVQRQNARPASKPQKAAPASAKLDKRNIASLDKKDASLNETEKLQVFNYYLAQVADLIAKYWVPPRMRLTNVRGFVKFEFDRSGKLMLAKIDRDSGDLLLDLSVVEAIKRVPQFPMPESESVWEKYYQGNPLVLEYTPAMLIHNKRKIMLMERGLIAR